MPSIGPLEMMMVAAIALIVFGPHKLPEIARSFGKAIAEFKRQATDIRAEFESGLDVDDSEDEKPAPQEPVADPIETTQPLEPDPDEPETTR